MSMVSGRTRAQAPVGTGAPAQARCKLRGCSSPHLAACLLRQTAHLRPPPAAPRAAWGSWPAPVQALLGRPAPSAPAGCPAQRSISAKEGRFRQMSTGMSEASSVLAQPQRSKAPALNKALDVRSRRLIWGAQCTCRGSSESATSASSGQRCAARHTQRAPGLDAVAAHAAGSPLAGQVLRQLRTSHT